MINAKRFGHATFERHLTSIARSPISLKSLVS